MENLGIELGPELSPNFWQDRRVLLTGHSGFKGGWLAIWLQRLGARVSGVSLPPESKPALYEIAGVNELCDSQFCDIRDSDALGQIVREIEPEVVFHLAAQPLVRRGYRYPQETIATNVMGTVHLLDALRGLASIKVALMVTTDKVYRDSEQSRPYKESDRLGGVDPYSGSKAASEILIDTYRQAFLAEQGVSIASARAGNVIGGGDWSADRLIPDAVRAWEKGEVLRLRSPASVRPWQHVLEPLHGYIRLVEAMWTNPDIAGPYNFGPSVTEVKSVLDVIQMAQEAFGQGIVDFDSVQTGPYEASRLTLDSSKARNSLGIEPIWSTSESILRTINWYRRFNAGECARKLCVDEICDYEAMI